MANAIQAIRGMNDVLPSDIFLWQHAENIMQQVLQSHGYHEIRLPIVEKTELFKRSIGEATDIVEKEMYTFLDRNDDSLSLRPEGTAGCVRAGIEHGLFHNQVQRLWYKGPYFRHERPQKGRYRQFYHFGVEAFGLEGPDIDAEIILMSARILEKLNLLQHVTLQLNSLGSPDARYRYRETLVNYFMQHQHHLDEDSQRRLTTNPLRILDSKNPAMQDLIHNAPKLLDYLDTDSKEHFAKLQNYLNKAGLNFTLNPTLVRGLDYYTKTVFEWTTDKLGSQSAICSGGRYDGLIEQLGGKATPALGFAFGIERVILLLQQVATIQPKPLDVYLLVDSETAFQKGLELANELREKIPGFDVLLHSGGGSLKNQFKKADKSGARFAVILGEQELQNHSVSIKHLREETPQVSLPQEKLVEYFK